MTISHSPDILIAHSSPPFSQVAQGNSLPMRLAQSYSCSREGSA